MAETITKSEDETAAFARALALNARPGDVFLLEGTLGAGKSVFARGFIRALAGENTDVPSPTFTIVQIYDTSKVPIYHFDLYRLEDPEEIYEIGWEEALAGGITLVEWPQRLGSLTPAKARRIQIDIHGNDERRITIDGK